MSRLNHSQRRTVGKFRKRGLAIPNPVANTGSPRGATVSNAEAYSINRAHIGMQSWNPKHRAGRYDAAPPQR